MNKTQLTLLASTLSLLTPLSLQAAQPDADELVHRFYGGAHAVYLDADENRLGDDQDYKYGIGAGIEAGFRISRPIEMRLSYTRMKAVLESGPKNDINKANVDFLLFPTEQNFYLMLGAGLLDYGHGSGAANLGLGYRHYFDENFAWYGEAKVNHQFNDGYKDGMVQSGFVLFFGSPKQAAVGGAAEAAAMANIMDTDNDGIPDSKDKCSVTPANNKVDEKGCTIFTEKELNYHMDIEFANNSAVIRAEDKKQVEGLADFMKQYPHLHVVIEGYASKPGTMEYNQELSEKRANAVKDELVKKYGIEESRVKAVGYGETHLKEQGSGLAANKANRHIEVNLHEKVNLPETK